MFLHLLSLQITISSANVMVHRDSCLTSSVTSPSLPSHLSVCFDQHPLPSGDALLDFLIHLPPEFDIGASLHYQTPPSQLSYSLHDQTGSTSLAFFHLITLWRSTFLLCSMSTNSLFFLSKFLHSQFSSKSVSHTFLLSFCWSSMPSRILTNPVREFCWQFTCLIEFDSTINAVPDTFLWT